MSASATAGLASASDRLARLGTRTASGDADGVSTAGEATAARVQMAASVTVARAANAMMGTLLDLIA